MEFNQREQIIALTAQWSGERFEDGRPRVPDSLLEALRGKPMKPVVMYYIQVTGVVILVSLMLFTTFNDLTK